MPFLSLIQAVSFPVYRIFSQLPTYYNHKYRIATAQKTTIIISFCPFSLEFGNLFIYLQRVSQETQDIVGSTLPITTSDKRSQSVTRASAYSAQAFQRLLRLVVSWECVGMTCAFLLDSKESNVIDILKL